jgi:hypothetical protein
MTLVFVTLVAARSLAAVMLDIGISWAEQWFDWCSVTRVITSYTA